MTTIGSFHTTRRRSRIHRAARSILVFCATLTFITCSDATAPNGTGRLEVIQLSPLSATAASIGEVVQFSAQTLDGRGDELSGVALDWTSSNPAVLVSEGNGRFRAVANGTAVVSVGPTEDATFPRRTAQVNVVQVAARIELIRAAPAGAGASDTLYLYAIRQTTAITAKAFDALGNEMIGGNAVGWTSSDPSIARVDATGTITALRDGVVAISFTVGQLTQSVVTRVASTFQISGCVSSADTPAPACSTTQLVLTSK